MIVTIGGRGSLAGVPCRGSDGPVGRVRGVDGPMVSSSGSTGIESPADEYDRLWETGAPVPDVFAFLASRR